MSIASPFLPPSGPASTSAVTTGAPIELHGYMATSDGEKFSIYDPAKKSATWVKLNETGYPFVVRTYKVVNSTDQVTVDYQGTTLTLALKQSKIASAAQAGVPGQGVVGGFGGRGGGIGPRGGNGPGGVPAVAPVPTAEELARLQAAAVDFQQRQAQRQQAQAMGQTLQQVAPAGQVQGNGQNGRQGNGAGNGNGGVRRAQRAQQQ